MSVADLLDLWSSDDEVAEGLDETAEVIGRWRSAGAVPEDKARELVEFALLRGHLEEVARMAAEVSPMLCELAGFLHDLGKSNTSFQDYVTGRNRDDPSGTRDRPYIEPDDPITRILDEMQSQRIFSGDPVIRVRALRAEWDRREELHDRIRASDPD